MLKCSVCKETKHVDDFYKDSSKSSGYRKECRKCSLAAKQVAYRSKKGLSGSIYNRQKKSSARRGHVPPTYSLKELRDWLYSQEEFHVLFDNWKRLDFQSDYAPSVDRKDDYIGYTLSNIQLMTWKENNQKGYEDRKNGINNKGSKMVHQYGLDGAYLKSYNSIAIASRETGISVTSIGKVCAKNKASNVIAGDFQWSFDMQSKIKAIKPYKRAVCQFTLNGEIMNKFNSISEASKTTGVNVSSILSSCKGRQKSGGGFMWHYSEKEIS